jgi:urease accessory protein
MSNLLQGAPMTRIPFVFIFLALASGSALAHPGHAGDGLAAGLLHPLIGADHLLAMVAVGLWAARFRGLERWALPSAFVGFMLLGALIARPGGQIPAEPMIAGSVLVLGIAVAAAVRLPAAAGAAVVAAFALFHGYAHVAEIPAGMPFAAFVAGMLVATALLHAAGVALGVGLARAGDWLPRALGGVITLAGAYLLIA